MPKPAQRARKAAVGLRGVLNAIRYWPVRVAAAMLPIPGAHGFLFEAIHEFALHIDGPLVVVGASLASQYLSLAITMP